jgi:hypothetical protein
MISFINVGLFRTISLLIPYAILFILCLFYLYENSLKILLSGYSFGLGIFILGHILNIIFFESKNPFSFLDLKNIFEFISYFGFEIYQALISYSAVLSFLACSIVIFSATRKISKQTTWLLMLAALIYFLLSKAFRKAVVFDICLTIGILIIAEIKFFYTTNKICRSNLTAIGFLCSVLIFFIAFTPMNMTFKHILEQRGACYTVFKSRPVNISLANIIVPLSKTEFNHNNTVTETVENKANFYHNNTVTETTNTIVKKPNNNTQQNLEIIKWSHFHNLFLAILYHHGFIGLIVFLLSFYYILRYYWLCLKEKFIKIAINKPWLIFVILSVIGNNIFNQNFQLPYYMINVYLIALLYLYSYQKFNQGILP